MTEIDTDSFIGNVAAIGESITGAYLEFYAKHGEAAHEARMGAATWIRLRNELGACACYVGVSHDSLAIKLPLPYGFLNCFVDEICYALGKRRDDIIILGSYRNTQEIKLI